MHWRLVHERRKEAKIATGIVPRSKGCPHKDATLRSLIAEQAYEIHLLKMGVELLQVFLLHIEESENKRFI